MSAMSGKETWASERFRMRALENLQDGWWEVSHHHLFHSIANCATLVKESELCPRDGWAVVTEHGDIHVNVMRLAPPPEWEYVLAHCLLHLAFGHFQEQKRHHGHAWNMACDCYIAKFLEDLELGTVPKALSTLLFDLRSKAGASVHTEEKLYRVFCEHGLPDLKPTGSGGSEALDMFYASEKAMQTGSKKKRNKTELIDWPARFAEGLGNAVATTITSVGVVTIYGSTESQAARNWFIGNFPLLGALAASFEIIEDREICQRMRISIAAINMENKEIYINPAARLNEMEMRFVMAHEMLHAGLRHDVRCAGRDPFLWNVACDYVINDWLIEMGVGTVPEFGVLHDLSLRGESSETIYDRIMEEKRRHPRRRIATMRGHDMGDILDPTGWWKRGKGLELDEFYRSALSQGLDLQERSGRGYLPAGLIEEVRALRQPPISWDVELAQWFDIHFPPTEKVRSYARLSRRQSSTPDIPRPLWAADRPKTDYERTFGVLLDTSGSMQRTILAKALGAIASYSIAREVPAVRVVFCDAATYDQGYMKPEEIAERVKIQGRGGTVLQPGIDLLERAKDFPANGPLLIITDGMCDILHTRRSHAFLMPDNRPLPFSPKGPVFKMK